MYISFTNLNASIYVIYYTYVCIWHLSNSSGYISTPVYVWRGPVHSSHATLWRYVHNLIEATANYYTFFFIYNGYTLQMHVKKTVG